ncbi:MAG: pyridoxal-phosphate dependent enzyme, partial [Prevotella sp.]|nr:pyridoxal-phosphate dependent enzyme [Prevotella sp.]
MNEKFKQTLKSSETEDWLALHIVRPFCYYWALLFARFDIHPNTVTILSMLIGAASAVFFGCASFYYGGTEGLILNIIGILLLMLADRFDCTDGQLARMTGKKSRLGRILDGVAGFAWFTPIYLALVYRFYLHHDLEFQWLGISDTPQNVYIATAIVFVLGLISGIAFAVKSLNPNIKVYGVQAAGAPSMEHSLKNNKIERLDSVATLADGIAVKEPGVNTFELCSKYVDEV